MSVRLVIFVLAASGGMFTAIRAHAQHFDIFLARPAAGTKTVAGGADVDALVYDDADRVFESELGSVAGEFLSLEPGVNHPDFDNPGLAGYPASAAPLQPGDVLRLQKRDFTLDGVSADLFFWNGIGPVSFTPAAAEFRIDGGDPLGSTAGVGGAFDDHPFLVVDDDSLPGVYLASVYGIVDGFAPSDALYLVMGTEALITPDFLGISPEDFDLLSDEELEDALDAVIDSAVEYVQTHVAVPEPGSLTLMTAASCGLLAVTRMRLGRIGGRQFGIGC
jgi:hypothetical protein